MGKTKRGGGVYCVVGESNNNEENKKGEMIRK